MTGVFLSLAIAALGGLLLQLLLYIWQETPSFYKAWVRNPDIRRLKAYLKQHGLEPLPVKGIGGVIQQTRYYWRKIPEGVPTQTYHFFLNEELQLEEFKAIMIPALDNNHGALGSALYKNSSWDRLSEDPWLVYLFRLGKKIKAKGTPAQRLIIFDKKLLNTFLESPAELKKAWGSRRRGGSLGELARAAIETAFEIACVHCVLQPFQSCISTIYLDKTKVDSNRYYDFGLYRLRKVPVVYYPVYRKGVDKKIVKEKILIGQNFLQHSAIKEFENDFDALFNFREGIKEAQKENLQEDSSAHFDTLSSQYYQDEEYDSYLFETFGRGYVQQIRKVLKEHFDVPSERWVDFRNRWKETLSS